MRKWGFLIALAASGLVGCSSISYYAQAVGGHIEVMQAARPIDDLLDDPGTEPALKKKLGEVKLIREFAVSELGLPDNGSYRSYADVGRPFVVWNVFAVPEFSLEPHKWCEPMVGCAGYRGFFSKAAAEQLARSLKEEGYDTHVGGVTAYSTLGYLSDPVLNTFLRFGSAEVARHIFHELAHQKIFASGDTVFNESFATAVENEGLRRWLAHQGNPELGRKLAVRYKREVMFIDLVTAYRSKLREVYSANLPVEGKRQAKAETISEMRRAYGVLKTSWEGASDYEQWFEQTPNNAKLATISMYTQLVPTFEAILEQEGHDLGRFYQRVAQLAALPYDERQRALGKTGPHPVSTTTVQAKL
jgi:predicted aminopeptidase